MTFYKFFDCEENRMVYINPKNILMYEYISQYSTYVDRDIDYVKVYIFKNKYIKVLLDDFNNMLFLEDIDEY